MGGRGDWHRRRRQHDEIFARMLPGYGRWRIAFDTQRPFSRGARHAVTTGQLQAIGAALHRHPLVRCDRKRIVADDRIDSRLAGDDASGSERPVRASGHLDRRARENFQLWLGWCDRQRRCRPADGPLS